MFSPRPIQLPFNLALQLRQRSAYWSVRGDKEDHETLQHARPQQANIQRTQAPEAYTARKRTPALYLLLLPVLILP